MKLYLIATALFVATLMFAVETVAQQTSVTARQGANRAEADEPWMYPAVTPASPTIDQINLLRKKTGFVETLGVRMFTSTTRVVPADVASFNEIVKWYADSIGETSLSFYLDRFAKTGISGPEIGIFEPVLPTPSSTHLTYRFTSQQKQITILHAEENGDVVTISLLGLDRETSIQVLRHHPNPKPLARNGGEPSVERERAIAPVLKP